MGKMKNTPYKNIIWLMLLSFLLKGIGFINRMVIAYFFGTSVLTDVYYIASGFIDSISSIILASFSVGIISIYIKEKQNSNKSNVFLTRVIALVELLMIGIAIICTVFAPVLAKILAPNLGQEAVQWLSWLLRILSLTLPFIGLGSVISSALQAESRFTPVKITGSITSVVSILCVIFLSSKFQETSLAISYLISNILNSVFVFVCIRNVYKFKFRDLFFTRKDFQQLFQLSFPLLVALAAHEINLIIDKSMATKIEIGATSALSYSSVLYLFFENIIINSVVTVIFPELSKKKNQGDLETIAQSTKKTILYTELLMIPLVIITYFFASNIVAILFQRGQFDVKSLELTTSALKGYVIGLPFLIIRDIITRVFYAYDDTKIPMIINCISVVINISLDFILGSMFGVFGITIATSISLVFSGLVMLILVKKKNEKLRIKKYIYIFSYLFFVLLIGVACSLIADYLEINIVFKLMLALCVSFSIELLYLKIFVNSAFESIIKLFFKRN